MIVLSGEWWALDPGSRLAPELTDVPARYTAAKRTLLANTSLQDDVKTHMLSSLVAGTVATTICAPADVLKSRIQAASKAGAGSSVSLVSFLPATSVFAGSVTGWRNWKTADKRINRASSR